MILDFLTKILGSKNDRVLKTMEPIVETINSLESKYKLMNDAQLKDQTGILKTETS